MGFISKWEQKENKRKQDDEKVTTDSSGRNHFSMWYTITTTVCVFVVFITGVSRCEFTCSVAQIIHLFRCLHRLPVHLNGSMLHLHKERVFIVI